MAGIQAPIGKTNAQTSENKNYTFPLVVVTSLFFMWGFITCLNDILIPFLKDEYNLSNLQANLVQSAFFGAYFIISLIYFIFSVNVFDPIQKIGYKNAIISGLVIAAIGCILFIPAATIGSFTLFLIALFVMASGITILQMGANPYVTLLGKAETSSSRLNMTQAFNSLGTTIAPVIGGLLIFGARSADAVQGPYIGLAIALIVLSLFILFSPLPRITSHHDGEHLDALHKGKGALAYSHLVLGVICIFAYVGGEVAVGSNLVTYLGEVVGMKKENADSYLAIFWGGAMIGRFYGSIFLTGQTFEPKKLINIGFILAFSFILGVFLVNKTYIVDSVVGQKQQNIITSHSDSANFYHSGNAIYKAGQPLPVPKGKESVSDIHKGHLTTTSVDTLVNRHLNVELFEAGNAESKEFLLYTHLKKKEVYLVTIEKVTFSISNLSFWEAGLFCMMALLNIVAFFIGKYNPARTLAIFACIVVMLLLVGVIGKGNFAMWSVLSIGLFNSIMFPTIFSLAIKGLGVDTSQGSSLLVMAIVGGGIVPPLQGYLADLTSVQFSFLVPIMCYAYIVYYGAIGSKPKKIA
jgi:fucose permease